MGLIVAAPAVSQERRDADRLLDRHRPILRYDGDEEYFAQPVGRPLGDPRERTTDLVYGHVATEDGEIWLQYWLFFAYNPQDRGIVHTGRHEGDWELLQIRLGRDGRPDLATLAQHSWAEGCAWSELERNPDDVPIVYVAHGSHALYSSRGGGDRPFPDPNDEADGRGREVRPPISSVTDSQPAWVAFEGRWGDSRAALIPGEHSSPVGPRFQPSGAWQAPATFHRERSVPCGSGPPGRWWTLPAVALAAIGIAGGVVLLGRRRRRA